MMTEESKASLILTKADGSVIDLSSLLLDGKPVRPAFPDGSPPPALGAEFMEFIVENKLDGEPWRIRIGIVGYTEAGEPIFNFDLFAYYQDRETKAIDHTKRGRPITVTMFRSMAHVMQGAGEFPYDFPAVIEHQLMQPDGQPSIGNVQPYIWFEADGSGQPTGKVMVAAREFNRPAGKALEVPRGAIQYLEPTQLADQVQPPVFQEIDLQALGLIDRGDSNNARIFGTTSNGKITVKPMIAISPKRPEIAGGWSWMHLRTFRQNSGEFMSRAALDIVQGALEKAGSASDLPRK